jgi:hypothetical protein
MANFVVPKGFIPAGTLNGAVAGPVNRYAVLATNGTAIFEHDLVQAVTTSGTGNQDLPAVTVMTSAGANIVGSVVGIYDSNGKPILGATPYLAASTAGFVDVYDSRDALFKVQVHDGGSPLTASACGDEADATFGAGSSTGNSGHELLETLKGAGAQGMFRIERLASDPNNTWAANAKVIVSYAEHLRQAARVAI